MGKSDFISIGNTCINKYNQIEPDQLLNLISVHNLYDLDAIKKI